MAKDKQIPLLLLYLLLSYEVVAFGPRLDSLKAGFGSQTNRLTLAASGNDHDLERELENRDCRRKLSLYRYEEIHNNKDTSHDLFSKRIIAAEPFIMDPAMFGIDNPFDSSKLGAISTELNNFYSDNIDDDCDIECSIPEEYKYVDQPIDVLMYLGIRRAEPVRTTLSKSIGWTS